MSAHLSRRSFLSALGLGAGAAALAACAPSTSAPTPAGSEGLKTLSGLLRPARAERPLGQLR